MPDHQSGQLDPVAGVDEFRSGVKLQPPLSRVYVEEAARRLAKARIGDKLLLPNVLGHDVESNYEPTDNSDDRELVFHSYDSV